MTISSLVRPLFAGAIDLVADVHGEIDALQSLLAHLGYHSRPHPEGRRLVFLGDLTDRGPDSPAVVDLVGGLLVGGLAQCVLGNHELNILLDRERHGNGWFYGKEEILDRSGRMVPQVRANNFIRNRTGSLFRCLPLALESESLRVVHACWRQDAVELLRGETDTVQCFRKFESAIVADLDQHGVTDRFDRELAMQNGNPVKVLTSGPEERAAKPFYAGGRMREECRSRWWDEYRDDAWVIFGHYWRISLPDEDEEKLFDDSRPYATLGNGRAMCIDYSVGKRWRERLDGRVSGFRTSLAALRWPERLLYFDDGRIAPLQ